MPSYMQEDGHTPVRKGTRVCPIISMITRNALIFNTLNRGVVDWKVFIFKAVAIILLYFDASI